MLNKALSPAMFRAPPSTPRSSLPSSALSHTRRLHLRLTPSNRVRIQNLSFFTAAFLSILTVSLAMNGANKVGLPCPAKRDGRVVGVDAQEQEEGWKKKAKGKGRWLDDPVVPVSIARGRSMATDGREDGRNALKEVKEEEGQSVSKLRASPRAMGEEVRRTNWTSWLTGGGGA